MDYIYAAIDYAKANVSENVYVIGHSQGGMSAPKIALDNDLKGVVMMAGTIRGLEDIVLDQNTAALEAMDQYSKKEKQQILKATQDGVAAVKALTEESTEPVLGIPAQYWLSLRDLDAENILKNKLDIPVLVLQGTADFQVYMDKDFEYMKSVLGHKENISFKAYDGLNHLFMPQSLPGVADTTEYNAENHIPQYVIDDIAEFIDDNSLSYYDNGEFVCRINNVVKTIEKNFPIRMSTPIDDEYMRFIDISAELYEAYAGYYCPITPGVETILVIEAKEGKVEEIKTKLQQRKDNIVAAYVNYTNDWKDKAKAGRIIVKGNYIALIIAGDEAVIEEKGVDVAYSDIDELLKRIFDK